MNIATTRSATKIARIMSVDSMFTERILRNVKNIRWMHEEISFKRGGKIVKAVKRNILTKIAVANDG